MNVTGSAYFKKRGSEPETPEYIFMADNPFKGNPIVIATYTPEKKQGDVGIIQFVPELAPLIIPFVEYCFPSYIHDRKERTKNLNEDNMPLTVDVGMALGDYYTSLVKEKKYNLATIPYVFSEAEVSRLKDVIHKKPVDDIRIDFTAPKKPESILYSVLDS